MVCGYVNYNPCIAVKVPAKAGKKKRDLPPNDEVEIIKESVNDEFGLFPFLLLYTGCRRNEALALRYEDINWDDKIITIGPTFWQSFTNIYNSFYTLCRIFSPKNLDFQQITKVPKPLIYKGFGTLFMAESKRFELLIPF